MDSNKIVGLDGQVLLVPDPGFNFFYDEPFGDALSFSDSPGCSGHGPY